MRPVTADNGVLIEDPLTEEGNGKTIGEMVKEETEAFKELDNGEFCMSNITVWYHYKAYLKDELEDAPFDHSYSTGIF